MHRRHRAGLHRPDERARPGGSGSPTAISGPPTAGPTMASPMSARATSRRSRGGRSSTTTSSTSNSIRCRASPGARRWAPAQDITQANRNPILGKVPGADGLKTGHTDEAGYGFTGSAEQNGRRLIEVARRPARAGTSASQESTRLIAMGLRRLAGQAAVQGRREGRRRRRSSWAAQRSRRWSRRATSR